MITKRKVILNTKKERAFRGILWKCALRYVVMRQVEMLKPGGEAVHMDGELVVFREDVDFIQVLK